MVRGLDGGVLLNATLILILHQLTKPSPPCFFSPPWAPKITMITGRCPHRRRRHLPAPPVAEEIARRGGCRSLGFGARLRRGGAGREAGGRLLRGREPDAGKSSGESRGPGDGGHRRPQQVRTGCVQALVRICSSSSLCPFAFGLSSRAFLVRPSVRPSVRSFVRSSPSLPLYNHRATDGLRRAPRGIIDRRLLGRRLAGAAARDGGSAGGGADLPPILHRQTSGSRAILPADATDAVVRCTEEGPRRGGSGAAVESSSAVESLSASSR